MLIDGANGSGVGYVFYQHLNDNDPNGEVTIINANSSALKDNQTNYSAIDCEILGLKFAVESNAYYLYGASEINIYTKVFFKKIWETYKTREYNIWLPSSCPSTSGFTTS